MIGDDEPRGARFSQRCVLPAQLLHEYTRDIHAGWIMVQVTVGKWGNNLAVRLPGEIVQAARLRDGERVEVEAHDGDVIIRRTEPQVVLADLFRGKTPEEWRAEYADVYDWGRGYRPRGRSR